MSQESTRPQIGEMLSRMRRFKQAAVASGILALLAGVGAFFGPFFTGEAVEGVLERVRRSLPWRRPRQPID
jgi:uncharacterized membrane protein HdeD (DUF308 family)